MLEENSVIYIYLYINRPRLFVRLFVRASPRNRLVARGSNSAGGWGLVQLRFIRGSLRDPHPRGTHPVGVNLSKGHYCEMTLCTVTLAKVDIGIIGLSHAMNGNILHSCMLRSSGSAKVNKYLDSLQRYYCHSIVFLQSLWPMLIYR